MVVCHEDRLDEPKRWRKPRRVFVCSMSDLFHEDVPDAFILRVWQTMADCPQHTFMVLTKRSERMAEFSTSPLPNVWCGVSIESERYLFRADDLRRVNAAVKFISFEPLLDCISRWKLPKIGKVVWAIIGGESGPGARLCRIEWVQKIMDWAREIEISCFVKQFGSAYARAQSWKHPKGGEMSEWPEWARIREWPDK